MTGPAIGRAFHRGELGTVFYEGGGYCTVQTSRGQFFMPRERVAFRKGAR